MTFTIEDIKRLIPEATGIEAFDNGTFTIEICGLYINTEEEWATSLLTTRRQLEIAMEALREVSASTSSSRLRRVTSEAIESIKKVGEA